MTKKETSTNCTLLSMYPDYSVCVIKSLADATALSVNLYDMLAAAPNDVARAQITEWLELVGDIRGSLHRIVSGGDTK